MMKVVLVLTTLLVCALAQHEGVVRVTYETDVKPLLPTGWADLGRADADAPIQLLFALRLRNIDMLKQFVDDVSNPTSANYGQYMTLEEIHALTNPPLRSRSEVVRVLRQWGVTVWDDAPTGGFLKVDTTVATAEALLDVKYRVFQHSESGVILTRAVEHYSLPSELAPLVQLVGGVFRFPRMPNRAVHSVGRSVQASSTTPHSIQTMYNITVPDANSNYFHAVASFLNQYYSPDDLAKFQSDNDLPSLPIEKTIGPNLSQFPGIEASLDVQFLTGVNSDTIRTWVWSTSGQESGGNEPFLTWLQDVDNTDPAPSLFSISYQDLEYTVSEDYADRCNQEFMKNNGRGITFITGSGDWGVGCEDGHCSEFTADFPSDSPYVTSTGATTLSGTAGEIGVGFSSGGFSNYFAQPSWQADAIGAWQKNSGLPSSSLYNISGKGFPDVAAIGTNFQVVRGGRTIPVGGTSASTPTFGSMLSMINVMRLGENMPLLGNVNPALYDAWSKCSNCFFDITQNQPQQHGCCSTGFDCEVGWDPVTGLGTPNFGNLADYFMSSSNFNNLE